MPPNRYLDRANDVTQSRMHDLVRLLNADKRRRIDCRRNDTGHEQVQVSVSEPIPLEHFPLTEQLLKEPAMEEDLEEIENVASLKSPNQQMNAVFRRFSSELTPLENRNINNCTHRGNTNCSQSTLTPFSADSSDSSTISWKTLLVILLVCVPLCLLLGCLGYRFISSRADYNTKEAVNVQTVLSPLERRDADRAIPDHVVRWLEDPIRHQAHDPVPLVHEDLDAYRLHMIQRAQAYGYNPLNAPIHIQLGPGPDRPPLSWQLSSS